MPGHNTSSKKPSVETLQRTIHKLEKEISALKENVTQANYRANLYHTKYTNLKESQSFPLTQKTGQNILSVLQTLASKSIQKP